MTRVSLKEAYDNKDVVAQIYAIRDIAEGAEDIANGAASTANTASEHVDALVPQVEGAVQNANNASASAQASAQTVTGYENRLSAVESETAGLDSDLGAVTLRVTTAEGQIVTIQGRVTALEGADAQNVKLAGAQNIAGIKTVPTEATGSRSQQIANSAKVGAELDNYAPMLRTTDNQFFTGTKDSDTLQTINTRPHLFQRVSAEGRWFKVFEYANTNRRVATMNVTWAHQSFNGGGSGRLLMGIFPSSGIFAKWLYRYSTATAFTADSVFVGITNDNTVEIWVKGGYFVYCEMDRIIRGNVEDAISNTANVFDGSSGVDAIDLSRFTYYAYGAD